MSRVARIFSTVLITAGLVIMADVGLTLAYKEPISSIYGEIKQQDAANQLKDLESRYPAIKGRLRDETGALRRFVNLYVNGEDVRFSKGLDTSLKAGDELSIVPAVAGG